MSLLFGDDYPEAAEPQGPAGPAGPAPAGGRRDRPERGRKRRDWPGWRGRRPRSMLIQDPPDPDEDGGPGGYGALADYQAQHYEAGPYEAGPYQAGPYEAGPYQAGPYEAGPSAAEPPEAQEYGAQEYGAREHGAREHGAQDGYDPGPPYRGNGFFLNTRRGPDGYPADGHLRDGYPDDHINEDRYPGSGYADSRDYWAGPSGFRDPGYAGPGPRDRGYSGDNYRDRAYAETGRPVSRSGGSVYPGSGHPGSGHPGSGHPGSGHPGSGHPGSGHGPSGGSWSEAEPDGFRLPPAPDDEPWDDGDYEPDPGDEPAGRRTLLGMLAPDREFRGLRRRESPDRDEIGAWNFVRSRRRLGGILLAGACLVGVALYVPSVLAAGSRSFTGVVSNSGVASLNFGASGRVGSVLVHLGQVVRKGEVLATESGAAGSAAVQADRAAITADKANLAALKADGSAAASITAAEAELAKDRARRAADQMKLTSTEIVAPGSGTVVAINGQPGETVSAAGLSSSAAHAQASSRQRPRSSLLPSGLTASLRAEGLALPVIALRTGGSWEVRLRIPRADTSTVKVGGSVTIAVPAAQLSGVRGSITELSPTQAASSGSAAYAAVVRVLGLTRVTPLSGLTANVQLGS